MFTKRVFVSFDEPCAFKCKHCYTYGISRNNYRSVDEIVDSISNEEFDVIYVSQKNDNFSNPSRGLELCERLFKRYEKDLFIITRSIIQGDDLIRMDELKRRMNSKGRRLFVAISINSMNISYSSEDTTRVATPEQRAVFLRELSLRGYHPILMLRPIFPNSIMPTTESIKVIQMCSPYFSCIVSSGLGVNEVVLNQLGLSEEELEYSDDQTYLQGAIEGDIKFVDVGRELAEIKTYCKRNNIELFEHSLPAISFVARESA